MSNEPNSCSASTVDTEDRGTAQFSNVDTQDSMQVSEMEVQDVSVADSWEDADLDALDDAIAAKRFTRAVADRWEDADLDALNDAIAAKRSTRAVAESWEGADFDTLDNANAAKWLTRDDGCRLVGIDDTSSSFLQGSKVREPVREETGVLASVPNNHTDVCGAQLRDFLMAIDPSLNPEFVARNLGGSLDVVVESVSDIRALDTLVRAGVKPLVRNKLYRAILAEKERPVWPLRDFLTKLGPQFDAVLISNILGSADLEDIVVRLTDLDDFESLVVAGMKPLHKNKLFLALEVERRARAEPR